VVHRVGGLADTVVDASAQALLDDRATGFAFDHATVPELELAIQRAVQLHAQRAQWAQLMRRAMAQDFSWTASARQYMALYADLVPEPPPQPSPRALSRRRTTV
jgi:starch synthase